MRRRHDPFLKRLYRAGTPDALSAFLPELAALLDFRHWHWIDKEILIRSKQSRSITADLVAETRDVDGRYTKVLVHPELQMLPDPEMNWRVFKYNAGLMLQEDEPEARVLSVVFYHCAGTGGIQERQVSFDFHGKGIHAVTYWSVGLGELEASEYAVRENPMGWALASWMRQQREKRVELRLQLMQKILRFVRVETYRELLLDTIQSYYRLSGPERRAEERLLRTGAYEEVEEMAQTVMERLAARARREGRQEGRQAGALEARQAALKEAIQTRFPDAPTSLTERVERFTDVAALQEMHRRVILAASVEEVERLLST
jgi:predicted transposase/invertase (TIGR01784 family)